MYYQYNSPRLLPGGGESYELVMGDIATIMAQNLVKCKFVDGGWFDFEFHNYLNYDRGTLCNVDNVRNCLMHFLKQCLNIPYDQATWTNEHGIIFDFRDYYIILGQELYHLVLRAANAHIWNYHHADCYFVIRALQAVQKAYQFEYDLETTPDTITAYRSTPYEVYDNSPIIDDNIFVMMQNVIHKYIQLLGTPVSSSAFITELQWDLNATDMHDEEEESLTRKGITAKYVAWSLNHLTERSMPRFESVWYIHIYTLFLNLFFFPVSVETGST